MLHRDIEYFLVPPKMKEGIYFSFFNANLLIVNGLFRIYDVNIKI